MKPDADGDLEDPDVSNHRKSIVSLNTKPQYGGVHLAFTSPVSDELFKMLMSCKPLVPRVSSLNEINLDFYFFNDNVFHFGKKNILPVFKLMCDEEERSGLKAEQHI